MTKVHVKFDLYFVTYRKHDRSQHIIAGPFFNEWDTQAAIRDEGSSNRGIVKTTMQFEEVDFEYLTPQ